MGVPGTNLYKMASKIIGGSSYTLFTITRVLDARGIWVDTSSAGTPLRDSIQAVPQVLYQSLGLDLARQYIIVYTSDPLMLAPDRDRSGNEIEFQGERYQLLDDTNWIPIDGWRGVMAIKLKATVPP